MKAPELEIEFDSDAWKVIEAHARKQLDDLRLKNDGVGHDLQATSVIRGRIAVWKELLDMPTKRREAEARASRQIGPGGY